MLYGSETWCLGHNEIWILQRTERAIVRNICGVTLMDKKWTNDPMQMLDFSETIDQLAKSNSVRWYGHVLRKDKNNFLREALDVNVKMTGNTWLEAVIEQSRKDGLKESDSNNRPRWRLGVNTISSMMRYIRPPPL